MKKYVLFVQLVILLSPVFAAEIVMPRVDPHYFIHQPQTDLEMVTLEDETLKEKLVALLFASDQINHMGSRSYDPAAVFEAYYKIYRAYYRLIDLDNDGIPELIFNGTITEDDNREFLEIYRSDKGKLVNVYNEIGHIMAYKIQPNTHEVVLYHHQYPCCGNASHNLNRLRLVEGNIQVLKRYFLGREHDMKGKFFPDSIRLNRKYSIASGKLELRWSGEVIAEHAWTRRSADNVIAHYDSSAVYKVLAEEKGWYFVLVHGAPLQEQSFVINPANFTETWIYGWVDKRKL